jgi:hypothetical protein
VVREALGGNDCGLDHGSPMRAARHARAAASRARA